MYFINTSIITCSRKHIIETAKTACNSSGNDSNDIQQTDIMKMATTTAATATTTATATKTATTAKPKK
jgi:hypothetical protein